MFEDRSLTMTKSDYERLIEISLTASPNEARALREKLDRAKLISSDQVPRDIVTMNSEVLFEDEVSEIEYRFRIRYPKDVTTEPGDASVLTPFGLAALGLYVGETADWTDSTGARKKLKLITVDYQPEAFGSRHL